MRAFDYTEPLSLAEALAALGDGPRPACALAGGTDLLPRVKRGQLQPARVVNLKRVPELAGIRAENGMLSIGAAVTLAELAGSPAVERACPLVAQAAREMASPQVRHLATVGGNLANASPAADLAPPLLVLGAVAVAARNGGLRRIPLSAFFLGPGRTALAPGELLVRVEVPVQPGPGAFLKFTARAALDLAVVSVACLAAGAERRVALGAVAPTPILVPPDPEAAVAASRPITDLRASAEYRRALVAVLVRRALKAVAE